MQHDGKLDNSLFRGPLYINKQLPREKLRQNNHKHGSLPKDLNKNTDTSNNTGPPQDTVSFTFTKVISVRFECTYYHINLMDNTHKDTHLIDKQLKYIEDTEVEQE